MAERSTRSDPAAEQPDNPEQPDGKQLDGEQPDSSAAKPGRSGSEPPALPDEVVQRAGVLLGDRFAAPVSVVAYDILNHEGHAIVARLQLTGAPVASAVVKLAHRDDSGAFDADNPEPFSPAARLWNEWAGLEYLSSLPTPCPTVPAFYGGDGTHGLVVMEDLGGGESLAHLLLGRSAERASAAMEGYVDALADVHLATFGRTDGYDSLRARLDGGTTRPDTFGKPEPTRGLLEGFAALDADLSTDGAVGTALDWVDSLVGEPGPWRAFTPNDCCPDNNRVDADGRVRLFDLEFATCRHALLDLAYVRATMPSCWCVRRFEPSRGDALVRRYADRLAAGGRSDLASGIHAPLHACEAHSALWAASFHLPPALEDKGGDRPYWELYDFEFGSRRQLFLQKLGELGAAADRQPELAPLRDGLVEPLRAAAARAWRVVEPLPLYPAFTTP